MRLSSKSALILSHLFVLSLLAGPAQAQQSAKLRTVTYGVITISALNWPFLIAEHQGMFQREGVDFVRVLGDTTTMTSQALVAGAMDFSQINLVQLLAANTSGADLVVVGGDVMVPIYTLIVDPSIKSYAELKGKRLAVAGPTDPLNYVLVRMLEANGLKPGEYEFLGLGGTPNRLAGVQKGGVAGAASVGLIGLTQKGFAQTPQFKFRLQSFLGPGWKEWEELLPRYAKKVKEMSGGRIEITLYPPAALVPASAHHTQHR